MRKYQCHLHRRNDLDDVGFSKASAYDKTPFSILNVSYAFEMKSMNVFDRCSVNDRREHIKKYVLSK